uniref:CCZ1/INTU/HPS4 third Longin domain-containing protein n=1 Tax=Sphenodon punctatus TaxID=8508 RepID=A0A8D0GKN9_SPHPU
MECGPPGSQAQMVRMVLYVHRIRGLVLSLLAEEQLMSSRSSVEDVVSKRVCSLSVLAAVSLCCTFHGVSPSSSTLNFSSLTDFASFSPANLPQVPCPQDRHFLRAASLIHSDFHQLPDASEITPAAVPPAGALHACRNAVQETYFQQVGSPLRNSGVPDSHDSAFSLPGKAKQKLLKHGVNLL